SLNISVLHEAYSVKVTVSHQRTCVKANRQAGCLHGPWGDERQAMIAREVDDGLQAPGNQCGLPVRDVIGAEVGGRRPAVTRCKILEELDSRPFGSAESRDAQASPKDVVQVLLLDVVVFALAGHLKTERIAIEPERRVRVVDNDCGVVDAQKQ